MSWHSLCHKIINAPHIWGVENGVFASANKLTLAAYEQARRALRGVCEPMRCIRNAVFGSGHSHSHKIINAPHIWGVGEWGIR